MDTGKIMFLIFICFIAGIFFWSLGASFLRVRTSRTTWLRTTGRIKSFGVNYGTPTVTYDYTVNAQTFEGGKFTPGPVISYSSGSGTSFPKSFFLHPNGTLKFAPGSDVEVFYDPSRPTDACLIQEMPSAKGLLIVIPLLAIFILGFLHLDWLKIHLSVIFPSAFVLMGLCALLYGSTWLKRAFRSRNFFSTSGILKKAEVVYSPGNGGGGYLAEVEFEYQVDGALYRSRQLKNLPLWVLKSREKDAQALVDRLRAQPSLRIFYDPKAPWDGFLEHVSLLGALTPSLLAIPSIAMGFFLGLRTMRQMH